MNIISNIDNINEELILIKNIFNSKESKLPSYVAVNAFVQKADIKVEIVDNNRLFFSKLYPFTLGKSEKESKYVKRFAKLALYEFLCKKTRYSAPWGALTGVRPSKLYYELLTKNKDEKIVANTLEKEYFVNKKKVNILEQIAREQSSIQYDYNSIDFYINIPFCTSKCYYCSFISLPLNKCSNLIAPYMDALVCEINATLEYLRDNNITINTIYIGGGTPTAIGVENLERILAILPETKELTVEAGRPDTIDYEMLEMLSRRGVNRISINPQSFNDDTLRLIGRNHSADDVVAKYNIARQFNFVINMDLIAGLGNEKLTDFKRTIQHTLSLNPDNITIHTLSIKRSSNLKTNGGDVSKTGDVERMIKYSTKRLLRKGYKPYYLYRQKNMLGNLENIGFFRNDTMCEFNINSMEETLSVIACGANAISKRIDYRENKITRHANVKNIEEYITRIDEMIAKKLQLFHHFNKDLS